LGATSVPKATGTGYDKSIWYLILDRLCACG
jgi:hypothetical protein